MKKIGLILLFVIPLLLAVPSAYAEEGEGAAPDPNAKHPEFAYVQMDPLSLPIITTRGLTQQVSLMVSLEVPFGQKDAFTDYKPRLIDAYIQDLYGALGAGYGLMRGNIVDVRQIKQRLTSVTGKVLGPDHKVHDVLLQVIQQHPI